jgi:hypothetical protein
MDTMPNIIVEVLNVATINIEGTPCSHGGKYGLDVSTETVEKLKAFDANGYIKLTLADAPKSDILKTGTETKATEPPVETPNTTPDLTPTDTAPVDTTADATADTTADATADSSEAGTKKTRTKATK